MKTSRGGIYAQLGALGADSDEEADGWEEVAKAPKGSKKVHTQKTLTSARLPPQTQTQTQTQHTWAGAGAGAEVQAQARATAPAPVPVPAPTPMPVPAPGERQAPPVRQPPAKVPAAPAAPAGNHLKAAAGLENRSPQKRADAPKKRAAPPAFVSKVGASPLAALSAQPARFPPIRRLPFQVDFVMLGEGLPAPLAERARGQWQRFLAALPASREEFLRRAASASPSLRSLGGGGRGIVMVGGGLRDMVSGKLVGEIIVAPRYGTRLKQRDAAWPSLTQSLSSHRCPAFDYSLIHSPMDQIPAWVCISMLRRSGCTLPVELWLLSTETPNALFIQASAFVGG